MSSTPLSWSGLALAVASVIAIFALWGIETSPDPRQLEVHHGVWTDEQGPSGNRIYFWNVVVSKTGMFSVIEGRVRVKNILDKEEANGTWNFENLEPLRLNVTFQDVGYVAAVRQIDADHLLVRYTTDVEEVTSGDVFAHPDTIRLTRVRGEDAPPDGFSPESWRSQLPPVP
jgi:hypothetical protein